MRSIEILHQTTEVNDDPRDWRWMPLDTMSLVRVSGEDAQSFLQAQFSNDIDSLVSGETQLNAYCNPKGRVLALPRVLKTDEALFMLVDSAVAPEFVQIIPTGRAPESVVAIPQRNLVVVAAEGSGILTLIEYAGN